AAAGVGRLVVGQAVARRAGVEQVAEAVAAVAAALAVVLGDGGGGALEGADLAEAAGAFADAASGGRRDRVAAGQSLGEGPGAGQARLAAVELAASQLGGAAGHRCALHDEIRVLRAPASTTAACMLW